MNTDKEEYLVIRNGNITPVTYNDEFGAIKAASKLAAQTGEQTHVGAILATCTPEPVEEDEDDGPCTCSLCRAAQEQLPPTPKGFLLFGQGPLDVEAVGAERCDVLYYNPDLPQTGWTAGIPLVGWAGNDAEGGSYALRAGSAISIANGLEDKAPAGPEETCPAGYLYFGKGPLKRIATDEESREKLVYCYDEGGQWDRGEWLTYKGDDDEFFYAVEAGTQLAQDNGLEAAPAPEEPSNPLAQALHAKAAFDELMDRLRSVDSPIFKRAAVLASITCLTEYLREVK